ncbi:MAG TPA: NAD-binding protein [Candidatus Limnocylindrales bacterium]|nr:NAD-binding protein [Candidatus Limnocylindrales bacterium]HEX5589538.1 NAD-binding protein [Candidatus Limnocylindrales bacterium]
MGRFNPFNALLLSPIIRRVAWHTRRIAGSFDRRFFLSLLQGAAAFVAIAALLVTILEKPWGEGAGQAIGWFGKSFNWAIFTILGQGDSAYVSTAGGFVVSWLLVLFGVAIVGTITGALVALVIDFLLKEGQGLGAAGYKDHIVVCGWNATARDLIEELKGDEYRAKVVVIADLEKNPAGDGVYFVRGETTDVEALRRAGIEEAAAALVFPAQPTNEADMHSILTVMAIESVAANVRTVAEVNNPRHADHFKRARVDEILITSRLASRLLARSALYPGLTSLVTDIVSGGEGSELYRVELPKSYLGLTIDELSVRLRSEHKATLLAVSRGSHAFVNPSVDLRLEAGDDLLVVAESLGTLAPLRPDRAMALEGQAHAHEHTHDHGHAPA